MLKKALLAITAAAAIVTSVTTARADDAYPSKPVKLVIGFAVGGPTDVIARVLAKDLTVKFGQTFVVENRPGANSMIATELVSRAPADGYTLLMSTLAHNVNAIIAADKIKYDPFNGAFIAWYFGGFGLIGALAFVFFFSHRRIWAHVEKDENRKVQVVLAAD